MFDADQYFADEYHDDRGPKFYCPKCAVYHLEEDRHDELDMCRECGVECEAALFAERAKDFQALSKEWWRRDLTNLRLHELADRDETQRKAAA